eukprot:jgi/Bigna1/77873/fgenesh1_pg.51_\
MVGNRLQKEDKEDMVEKYQDILHGFDLNSPRSQEACRFLGVEKETLLRRGLEKFQKFKDPSKASEEWEAARRTRLLECVIARGALIFNADHCGKNKKSLKRAKRPPKRVDWKAKTVPSTPKDILRGGTEKLSAIKRTNDQILHTMLLQGLDEIQSAQKQTVKEELERIAFKKKVEEREARVVQMRTRHENRRLSARKRATARNVRNQKALLKKIEAKDQTINKAMQTRSNGTGRRLKELRRRSQDRLETYKRKCEKDRARHEKLQNLLNTKSEKHVLWRLEQQRKKVEEEKRQAKLEKKRYQQKLRAEENLKERLGRIANKINIKHNEMVQTQLRREKFLRDQKEEAERMRKKRLKVRDRHLREIQAEKERLLQKQAKLERELQLKTDRLKAEQERRSRAAKKAWLATQNRIAEDSNAKKVALERAIMEKDRLNSKRVERMTSARGRVHQKQAAEAKKFSYRREQLTNALATLKANGTPLWSLTYGQLIETGMPAELAEKTLETLKTANPAGKK